MANSRSYRIVAADGSRRTVTARDRTYLTAQRAKQWKEVELVKLDGAASNLHKTPRGRRRFTNGEG